MDYSFIFNTIFLPTAEFPHGEPIGHKSIAVRKYGLQCSRETDHFYYYCSNQVTPSSKVLPKLSTSSLTVLIAIFVVLPEMRVVDIDINEDSDY